MLTIRIELLAGRWVATEYNDRESAEWPPHPARVFSALVATFAEGEPDSSEAERAALEWLQALAPPVVVANAEADVARRTVAPVFVPVNDASALTQPSNARGKLEEAQRAVAEAVDSKSASRVAARLAAAEAALLDATRRETQLRGQASPGVISSAMRVFPELRGKQPRTFPSLCPALPRFALVWPDADPGAHRAALGELLARLVRVGHSSTPVAARLGEPSAVDEMVADGAVHFVPDDERGTLLLRWCDADQLARLEEEYERHGEVEARVLSARFVRYRIGAEAMHTPLGASIFAPDVFVLARTGGPRLPVTAAEPAASALRRALMSVIPNPIPEFVSGHRANGDATDQPHLAIVPLPNVGSQHADGAILGFALVLPRDASTADRAVIGMALRAMEHRASPEKRDAHIIELLLGELGVIELMSATWDPPPQRTLQPGTWTQLAEEWYSATPVALDRNPGNLNDSDPRRRGQAYAEAVRTVRSAVERVLEPGSAELLEIEVSPSVLMRGTAKPSAYPRFPANRERTQRLLVHVRLRFDRPVRGPLLVGAGRFIGLGLLYPIPFEARARRRTDR